MRVLIYIIFILFLPNLVNGTNANNTLPPVEKPLPTNKINLNTFLELSKEIEGELVKVSNGVEKSQNGEEVIPPSNELPIKGKKKFYFPAIDDEIEKNTGEVKVMNGDDPNFSTQFFVEMGTGGYSEKIQKARNVMSKAKDIASIVASLNGENLLELPLLVEKEIGNITTRVVFNKMELFPEYAEIEIFAGVIIPQEAGEEPLELMFAADGVKFSSSGGFVGTATLGLLGNVAFELGGSNAKVAIVLNAWSQYATPFNPETNTGTYITVGCGGVEEFGIEADIIFSREWLIPTNDMGDTIPITNPANPPRVKAHFATRVQDWNNMLFENISIDHFVLAKYDQISFYVGNANIDLSDLANPQTLELPNVYYDNGTYIGPGVQGNILTWRGVYIEMVEITLPSPFKKDCDGYGYLDSLETDNSLEGLALNESLQLNHNVQNYYDDIHKIKGGPSGEDYFKIHPDEIPKPSIDSSTLIVTSAAEKCRIKVGAKDLFIDNSGVTGEFYIVGEAPLIGGGKMDSKWSFSLDSVAIKVVQSDLVGFGFAGVIGIPISDNTTPIHYEGSVEKITNGNDVSYDYSFYAGIVKKMKFPLWKAAEVELSTFTLGVAYNSVEDEFKPSVRLSGILRIGNPNDFESNSAGEMLKVPSLKFHKLVLSTNPNNYFDIEQGGYIEINTGQSDGQGKLANFPIKIDNISFTKTGAETCKLGFNLKLNLIGNSDGGISGEGTFYIHSKLSLDGNGAQKWVYDNFEFSGCTIEIDLAAFKGTGTIAIFKDHVEYGTGFYGKLEATFLAKEGNDAKFKLEAMAVFGRKETYRYFMVDAYVGGLFVPVFPTPATPATSVLHFSGFGGGLFFKMRQNGWVDGLPPVEGEDPAENAGLQIVDTSGITYKPDNSTLLGIKFCVGFGIKNDVGDGKLTVIVRFGPGMSLQNIMFWGVCDFMLDIDHPIPTGKFEDKIPQMKDSEEKMHNDDAKEAQEVENKISAKVGISFDFEDGFVFHGYAEVFMNLPDVANLQGRGTFDLLIGGGDWHLFVGGYPDGSLEVPGFMDPGSMVTLYPVSAGLTYAGIDIQADLYFLLGTGIPGPPPLDPEVAAFFNSNATDINPPAENEEDPVQAQMYCDGRSPLKASGLAFGTSAKFKLVEEKSGLFGSCFPGYKVNVKGGVGFNAAYLMYGKGELICSETGEPAGGLNGSRLTATFWAFLETNGGHVCCIPIPNLGVGLMAEFDGFKPTFVQATVIVKVVKKLRFKLPLGTKCGFPCTMVTDYED